MTQDTSAAETSPRLDQLKELVPYLSRWLATQVEVQQVPGAQVAVRLGGELVLSEAFGDADQAAGEALTTEHLFRVASHSKTFTAVAVMQLVEAGRLRLDDTVADLLDDYADTPLAGATVRELLSHTSGAIRDGVDSDFWQLDRPFPDAAALRETVAEHGATYQPQEHFKYSNIGYGVLGAIIERLTGTDYVSHVTAAVLEPLGLERTSPELAEAQEDGTPRLVTGHSRPHGRSRSRVTVGNPTTGALAAATGFVSTAEELSRFFASLAVGGDGLLTDRSLRLMQRAESTVPRGGDTETYGLGIIGAKIGERKTIGHSGGFPGQITRTLVDPKGGLTVCVLTNAVDGPAESLAIGLVELIDLLTTPPADWQKLPEGVTEEDLKRLTGRYCCLWGETDVVFGSGRLVMLDPTFSAPVAVAQELRALDATTLRVEDKDGFGASGEEIPFDVDDDGRVTRMRVTGVSSWPEEQYLARRSEAWT